MGRLGPSSNGEIRQGMNERRGKSLAYGPVRVGLAAGEKREDPTSQIGRPAVG